MPSGVVRTSTYAAGVACVNATSQSRLDTFWTVCTTCKIQYEYLRKYVNKRLSCKNCRGTFIAVETGSAPVNGSFPYCPWSYMTSNGYGSHGNGVTHAPTNATFFTGNGVSGYHSGHGYENVPNMSFQRSSFSGTSTEFVRHIGVSAVSTDAIYQSNGDARVAGSKVKSGANGKTSKSFASQPTPYLFNGYDESLVSKPSKVEKKRKVINDLEYRNGFEDKGLKSSEAGLANGIGSEPDPKLSNPSEPQNRRCLQTPAFDVRKLLIDKARTGIRKKLEEIKFSSEAAAAASVVKLGAKEYGQSLAAGKGLKRTNLVVSAYQSASNKGASVSITVPDSDFHDFDKDRSEECFKPKQIWALYDEDDGMPRLYCLIRQVISEKPFKIHITYLNSKTDNEFGLVNWVDSGFTKSCGHFRAWNSDIIDQVNIFSHLLRGQKAGRGGCVCIFPKKGDVWAVYRNWSPDWNRSTPDDVRHQYEMVEVLEDYSEELGAWGTPIVKLIGFKTVYQRNTDKDAVRWIPRKEMFRLSHPVPAWLLEGASGDLPDRCWDLDPAATPEELLHDASEAKA
ncbi:hypothetical protein F3Y22_tig00110216pilonHSYRG00021 [Hibiscus syriacus]|uniref:Uncharacterized protein n=1 Tax=Hibiscus syriacus TaxID=106335 RepID=A0A6A3B9N4_HIBSY|nr:hypothetical protein F3Y22_tig00110216pilonHSYRG00021 [Hibiscus syriacus]